MRRFLHIGAIAALVVYSADAAVTPGINPEWQLDRSITHPDLVDPKEAAVEDTITDMLTSYPTKGETFKVPNLITYTPERMLPVVERYLDKAEPLDIIGIKGIDRTIEEYDFNDDGFWDLRLYIEPRKGIMTTVGIDWNNGDTQFKPFREDSSYWLLAGLYERFGSREERNTMINSFKRIRQ